MRLIFKKIAVGILIFALSLGITIKLFSQDDAFILAQEAAGADAESPQPQTEKPISAKCPTDIEEKIRDEVILFSDFVTTHFQNEADTSVLLPQAMDHFRLSYLTIILELDKISTAYTTAQEYNEVRESCKIRVNDTIFAMKQILKMHALANSQGKRATKLVDKYKIINDKLEKLNFNIAQMYGYFLTFSKKLPCYAEECN